MRYHAQSERHYRRAVEEFERVKALRPELHRDLPVAAGIAVAHYPPLRSVRAVFPHTAPTLDEWRQSAHSDTDA
jgi:hypothetical protein